MKTERVQRLNAGLGVAAVAIALLGVGSGLVNNYRVTADHATVLARVAEINNQPATRSARIDEHGATQHTLCSGGGLCVTDRVPPLDWNAPEQRAKQSGIGALIDVPAVCAPADDFTAPELMSLSAEDAKFVEKCKRLNSSLRMTTK
jgi:hypothetical protein